MSNYETTIAEMREQAAEWRTRALQLEAGARVYEQMASKRGVGVEPSYEDEHEARLAGAMALRREASQTMFEAWKMSEIDEGLAETVRKKAETLSRYAVLLDGNENRRPTRARERPSTFGRERPSDDNIPF